MSCRHGNWSGCEVCEEIEKAEMDMDESFEPLERIDYEQNRSK